MSNAKTETKTFIDELQETVGRAEKRHQEPSEMEKIYKEAMDQIRSKTLEILLPKIQEILREAANQGRREAVIHPTKAFFQDTRKKEDKLTLDDLFYRCHPKGVMDRYEYGVREYGKIAKEELEKMGLDVELIINVKDLYQAIDDKEPMKRKLRSKKIRIKGKLVVYEEEFQPIALKISWPERK